MRVKLSFLKVRVQNLQLSCLLRSIWKANGVSALSNKIWQSWDPIGQAITSGTSGDNYRKQNRGATIKMHRRYLSIIIAEGPEVIAWPIGTQDTKSGITDNR